MISFLCFVCLIPLCLTNEKGIASKESAKPVYKKRCSYNLRKLWETDVSSYPFTANPLVTDIDGDGNLDVVVAPFGETVAVVEGESGKYLSHSNWPVHNLEKSVHSSPLQYDINGDGVLDILVLTSQGEALFYTAGGLTLPQYTFKIPPVHVQSDWYTKVKSADHTEVSSFVLSEPAANYLPVDVHVLATPALHERKDLVIPVSYYFSEEDYNQPNMAKPWGDPERKEKFFVTGIVTVDLKELEALRSTKQQFTSYPFMVARFLELRQTPTFVLFTPTVLDLDGKFGPADVVIGSTSGKLSAFGLQDSLHRTGFPHTLDSISGTVTAANLKQDKSLELIAVDTQGKVTCLESGSGKVLWTAQVEASTSFAGTRVVDLDNDGQLDVVMATEKGNVYALNGHNGSVFANYPYKAGSRIAGNILVTKFIAYRNPFDLVFLSDDGVLHILASDHSCVSQVRVDATSLVDITSHDLVSTSRGMEFLVATSDGSLICLGSGAPTPPEEITEKEFRLHRHQMSSRADSSPDVFSFGMRKVSVYIDDHTRKLKEVTGNSFTIYFNIYHIPNDDQFDVQVFIGSDKVYSLDQVTVSTAPQWLHISTPDEPGQAHVTIVISDRYGFTASDTIFLKFNQLILLDLQWLVLAPFIAMVVILLVNHGFPAKDLLPVTFPFKSK